MKKMIWFTLLSIMISPVTFCQRDNKNIATPKIYAVIVGISDYKDADIPDLKYAEKDAIAFYDFLRSKNAGSIPEDNIALLTGNKATRSNILYQVIDKFTRSNNEDLVIFYFSGHGRAGELENMGYLLNYDAENDNAAGSAVSMDDVKTRIDKCKAKMKISYIDACHAGLFNSNSKGAMVEENSIIINSYLAGLARANGGNISFLASFARQQSIEDDKLGHGVFTYYLLNGLKGAADMVEKEAEGYNNGIVTSGELAYYITNTIRLATKTKQSPTIEGDKDGLFPLSVLRDNISIYNEINIAKVIKIEGPGTTPVYEPAPIFEPVKCYKCKGEGIIIERGSCYDCKGTGKRTCLQCRGSGQSNTSAAFACDQCAGKGYKICSTCNGKKIVTENVICPICNGKGEITNKTKEPENGTKIISEETSKSKDIKGCESNETGDYCFENKSNRVMYVCLYTSGKGYGFTEIAIDPGQKQTFYDKKAITYDYVIGSKRWTWYMSDAERNGQIRVEKCLSKTFVIK